MFRGHRIHNGRPDYCQNWPFTCDQQMAILAYKISPIHGLDYSALQILAYMSHKKFFLSGLSSYLIWGFVPVFLKILSEYDDLEVIFYRMLMAAVVIAIMVPSVFGECRRVLQESRSDFGRMMVRNVVGGALLATNWVSYIYVVNHVSINAASFAYLILPIATAFLAYFTLAEKLTTNKWAGVVLSGVSCYLMANIDIRQILYISAITLSYAFYLITQRRNTLLSRRVSLTIQMAAGTALMLLINPVQSNPVDLGITFWTVIVVLSVFFTITPLLLNLYALNGMESSQLAFLIYVNPIISFWIGILGYGESLNVTAIVAYSLLAVAIVIFNWDILRAVVARAHGRRPAVAPDVVMD